MSSIDERVREAMDGWSQGIEASPSVPPRLVKRVIRRRRVRRATVGGMSAAVLVVGATTVVSLRWPGSATDRIRVGTSSATATDPASAASPPSSTAPPGSFSPGAGFPDRVPVLDKSGKTVGYLDKAEIFGSNPAAADRWPDGYPVHDFADGRIVGHMTSTGFVPLGAGR